MLVELWQPQNGLDHVCLLVHDDYCCCSQTTLKFSQSIEVHQNILAKFLWQKSYWWSTWNDGFKIVPSTNDTAAVSINEFFQRNWHLFFDCAWIVDMARNTEKFCSSVVWSSERREPGASSSEDGWADGNCLDISDCGWAVKDTTVCWEWWFQSWFTGLSFQTFNKAGLFAADVSTCSTVNVNIKIVAWSTGVFTQKSSFVGLELCIKILLNRLPVASNWLRARILLWRKCKRLWLSWKSLRQGRLRLICEDRLWGFLCLCRYRVRINRS